LNSLKNAGAMVLGLAVLAALMFLAGVFIIGTALVADKILSFLVHAATIATAVCILLFLPMALFRVSRVVALWGFFAASYLFGLTIWMYGFLVTYYLWGAGGVFIGLMFAGIGVVPLGIIAAAFHEIWHYVGELIYGIVLTFGSRAFALYLAKKVEAAPRVAV
jgi:hypothetical protein